MLDGLLRWSAGPCRCGTSLTRPTHWRLCRWSPNLPWKQKAGLRRRKWGRRQRSTPTRPLRRKVGGFVKDGRIFSGQLIKTFMAMLIKNKLMIKESVCSNHCQSTITQTNLMIYYAKFLRWNVMLYGAMKMKPYARKIIIKVISEHSFWNYDEWGLWESLMALGRDCDLQSFIYKSYMSIIIYNFVLIWHHEASNLVASKVLLLLAHASCHADQFTTPISLHVCIYIWGVKTSSFLLLILHVLHYGLFGVNGYSNTSISMRKDVELQFGISCLLFYLSEKS